MTDRAYPSATKPPTATTTVAAPNNNHHTTLPIPPTKTNQLYNPTRHPYRQNLPQKKRSTHKRNYFCCCCFWSILILFVLLVATTFAGAIAYSIYQPQRPTFAFTSLKISQFNLTTASDDSTRLTTKLNITLSSTNPNKKIILMYDAMEITALSTQEVELAKGSFKSFTSTQENVTYIHTQLSSASQVVDADSVKSLRSDLKKKSGVPLKVILDTKVVVKADNLKSKKVGIRIKCEGVHASVPKGKSVSVASVSKAKCKVDLRIKIWKWTF